MTACCSPFSALCVLLLLILCEMAHELAELFVEVPVPVDNVHGLSRRIPPSACRRCAAIHFPFVSGETLRFSIFPPGGGNESANCAK